MPRIELYAMSLTQSKQAKKRPAVTRAERVSGSGSIEARYFRLATGAVPNRDDCVSINETLESAGRTAGVVKDETRQRRQRGVIIVFALIRPVVIINRARVRIRIEAAELVDLIHSGGDVVERQRISGEAGLREKVRNDAASFSQLRGRGRTDRRITGRIKYPVQQNIRRPDHKISE
mgnify:CR=1 FL=1